MGRPASHKRKKEDLELPHIEEPETHGPSEASRAEELEQTLSEVNAAKYPEVQELLDVIRQAGDVNEQNQQCMPLLWTSFTQSHSITKTGAADLSGVEVDEHGAAWLVSSRKNGQALDWLTSLLSTETSASEVQPQPTIVPLANTIIALRVAALRQRFDEIPSRVFRRIRGACNPAECIGKGPFVSRSAMKLMVIDKLLGIGTAPQPTVSGSSDGVSTQNTESTVSSALRFVDLCGGPGGFSEYICWREYQSKSHGKKPSSSIETSTEGALHSKTDVVRGWGMTLCAEVDDDVDREGCDWEVNCLAQWGAKVYRLDTHEKEKQANLVVVSEPGESSNTEVAGHVLHYTSANHTLEEKGTETVQANTEQTPANTETVQANTETVQVNTEKTPENTEKTPENTEQTSSPFIEFVIVYGPDNTGDITSPMNREALIGAVKGNRATEISREERGSTVNDGVGVDWVFADGGAASLRDSDDQESASLYLVVCEIVLGLSCLKVGGGLFVKLLGAELHETAALVTVLHAVFEKVGMIKPITCRPASSERYLVCKGLLLSGGELAPLLDRLNSMCDLLQAINHAVIDEGDGTTAPDYDMLDVWRSLITQEALSEAIGEGGVVGNYMRESNDAILRVQSHACAEILEEAANENLHEQEEHFNSRVAKSQKFSHDSKNGANNGSGISDIWKMCCKEWTGYDYTE